jgi:hypothetical protein
MPEPADRYTDDEWHMLNQDIFQIDVGRYVLDVGWFPDCDPGGAFHCRIVETRDDPDEMARAWSEPDARDECFTTTSAVQVLDWLNVSRIRAERATAERASICAAGFRAPAHRNCPHHNAKEEPC